MTFREVKKWRSRCGSQSRLPGKAPLTKPTWPPAAGCSRRTAGLTSAAPGRQAAGKNGSFFGLTASAGTAMAASQGLAEAAAPVVAGAGEAVQRRGDGVVEFVQVGGAQHARLVEQAGKARRRAADLAFMVARKCRV
jgi:hypothetical protein